MKSAKGSFLLQLLLVALIVAAGAGGWFLFADKLGGTGKGTAGQQAGGATGGQYRNGGIGGGGGSRETVVLTEPARTEHARNTVRAVGTGDAVQAVDLFPSVSGEVATIAFHPGQKVMAGDVLVKLDDDQEQLELKLAQLQVTDATNTLARYDSLAPTGAVSATEVDKARVTLDQARNALDQARVALDHRSVKAPFNGMMGLSMVDVGDRVTPTSRLGSIDDRSSLLVEFEVPEAFAAQLQDGQEIEATTPAFLGRSFAGAVAAIDSRIDPMSRTIRVRALLPNDEDLLRPGMSFAVTLSFPLRAFPSVAEAAVQWGRDGAGVWRVADGKAERVPVTMIERSEGRVLVSGDLKAGDHIIIEGIQKVRPGLKVSEQAANTGTGS
ncbi:efflux RND transporter periplasmic adaptor subunit [Radicibacter daui]|uniref:efflux RND transporter periplasmic adaptor subunit n=1 Tax=Radicibacter daui TaxID=3064829 RepID=UPI004046987D